MKTTVLVIEDHDKLREAMCRTLALHGYEPVEAATGSAALAILLGKPTPAVVLLDLMLPDISGAEVLQTIRRRGLAIRVVVITAVGPGPLLYAACAASPDAVLPKPAQWSEILAAIGPAEQPEPEPTP